MTITIMAQTDFSEANIRAHFAKFLRETDSSDWDYGSDEDEKSRGTGRWDLANYADRMVENWLETFYIGDLSHITTDSRAELESIADAVYNEVQPEISREIDEANREAEKQDHDYRAAAAGGVR